MKRIKPDEIHETVRNYVKQRNISKLKSTERQNDFNLMASNELALIESSINNYYSYALNSASYETDCLNQFESYELEMK